MERLHAVAGSMRPEFVRLYIDDAAGRQGAASADAALRVRQERLLDEALEETFPASDSLAVMRLT